MKYIEKKQKYRLEKSIEDVAEHYIMDSCLSYWNGNKHYIEKDNFNNLINDIMIRIKDFLFVYHDMSWR